MDPVMMVGEGTSMDPKRGTTRRSGRMYRWLNPAAFVLLGYAVLAVLIFWVDLHPARVALAIVLVLFGSGYSLVTILFPDSSYLDWLEKLALAGGLSLAVGGMSGFALAISIWGLEIVPLLITAVLFNSICYAVIVYQRRKTANVPGSDIVDQSTAAFIWMPETKRYRDAVSGRFVARDVVHHALERESRQSDSLAQGMKHWVATQSTASLAITVALMLVISLGIWTFGRAAMVAGGDPPMTEFYLLDENNMAEDYPVRVHPDQNLAIHYGIVNREGQTVVYRVEAAVEGETIGKSEAATLNAGETLQDALILVWPKLGAAAMPGSEKVEFILYREEQAYRALHLWLDVTSPQATTSVRELHPAPGPTEHVSQ